MLRRADQAVPVGLDIFRGAADLGHILGDVLGGDHFDRIPRADGELVRIRLLLGNVHTDLTADAPFDVDFAPGLAPLHGMLHFLEHYAVDRADLQTRLAAGAVVGVDDSHFLGQLLTGTGFGHGWTPWVIGA